MGLESGEFGEVDNVVAHRGQLGIAVRHPRRVLPSLRFRTQGTHTRKREADIGVQPHSLGVVGPGTGEQVACVLARILPSHNPRLAEAKGRQLSGSRERRSQIVSIGRRTVQGQTVGVDLAFQAFQDESGLLSQYRCRVPLCAGCDATLCRTQARNGTQVPATLSAASCSSTRPPWGLS